MEMQRLVSAASLPSSFPSPEAPSPFTSSTNNRCRYIRYSVASGCRAELIRIAGPCSEKKNKTRPCSSSFGCHGAATEENLCKALDLVSTLAEPRRRASNVPWSCSQPCFLRSLSRRVHPCTMLRRALGRLRTTLGPESEDSVSRLAARKTWRQASVKFEEQRALWRPVLAHYLPYRLAVVPRNLPRPLSQVDQIRRAIRLPVPTCLPSLGNPRLHDEVFGNWKGGQLVNWRSKYHAAYHHERLEWVGDRILNATAGTLVFVLAPVKELAAPGANPELLWLQTT